MSDTANWDLTVSSKNKLINLNFREIIHNRDLIVMFFIRDFKISYKQTILGPIWHILSPLLTTCAYIFLFSGIAYVKTDGIPVILFYYGGTMLWTLFSTCLNNASAVFIQNASIFDKIYFPRLTVPIATTLSAIVKMLIQFATLMVFLIYYILIGHKIRPSLFALLFPVMVIWICVLGTSIGMIMSVLTTKYRDLNMVLALVIQLAMFLTPVVYPLSQVPERFKFVFYINPVSAPMELFRIWFYGAGQVPDMMIIISIGVTITVFILGLILFTHNERTCMDII